ncbi:UDP-N-acetylglucosamine transferase subunit ALG13 homolog [Anneissia japonica]|uniref:UDP-N-acetylglucosamine transferase subunit ALG13 homolog n=1 Tax=Anneissia japonica TaxID=1529436 RepID=UPI0014256E6C|nr:UDP-N-acetylglucosamine transferase subunit ALG13 homolog [Anneissia japonica]
MTTVKSAEKVAFVTVGTTSFDAVIETVSSLPITTQLERLGYTKVILQIGRGTFEPEKISRRDFRLEYYRYKDSITEDIKQADLIISHAGAGSVMETLEAGKPLIVVVNELLMGNHQIELAYQLYEDGHLQYCTCSTLLDTLKNFDESNLKPYPKGQPENFARFLDKAMGLSQR